MSINFVTTKCKHWPAVNCYLTTLNILCNNSTRSQTPAFHFKHSQQSCAQQQIAKTRQLFQLLTYCWLVS